MERKARKSIEEKCTKEAASPTDPEPAPSDDACSAVTPSSTSGIGREHPLENPAVLSVLFEHCSLEQLMNVRLVNKQWLDLSLPCWRQRSTIIFEHSVHSNGNTLTLLEFLGIVNTALNTKGMDDPYQILKHPFKNYIIKNWICPTNWRKLTVSRFWELCGGHWVQELCLDKCEFKDISTFNIILDKTPNLRKLSIQHSLIISKSSDNSQQSEYSSGEIDSPQPSVQRNMKCFKILKFDDVSLPVNWNMFFRRFPCVEELVFEFRHINLSEVIVLIELVLVSARDVRKLDSRNLCVKHLDLLHIHPKAVDDFPMKFANVIESVDFPLETLKLDIGYQTSVNVVKKMLSAIGKTIKTLVLFCAPFSRPIRGFPFGVVMEYLEHLEMFGPIADNFGFLKYCPKLKQLHILRKGYEEKIIPWEMKGKIVRNQNHNIIENTLLKPGMRALKIECLHELRLDIPIVETGTLLMFAMRDWMPNLNILHIHILSAGFHFICHLWKSTLRELCVFTDAEISGNIIAGCSDGRLGAKFSWNTTAHISSLQELETLEIRIWEYDKDNCSHKIPDITVKSILHGLMCLPKLRSLKMDVSEDTPSSHTPLTEKGIKVETTLLKSCICGENKINQTEGDD